MNQRNDVALLIVAHGSTVNPDSSAPTLTHAATIRRRNVFADVACAFWKEEPSLRDAIFLFEPESVREVCVVPNFISEDYFTQTVVPWELELNSRITERSNGQIWKNCEPVGNHPMMTDLLLHRAHFFAVAAQLMRRIMVDHARQRQALKRGGGAVRVTLDESLVSTETRADELIALDEALEKLAAWDKRKAEVVEMRYFGGLTMEEISEVLKIHVNKVMRDWRVARAWLMAALSGEDMNVI